MTVVNAQVQADMLAVINTRIDNIAGAEKITKSELGILSREILTYVVLNASGDVQVVNRLLTVLTPMNLKVSQLFFSEFLPHKFEDGLFGGKFKGEKKLDEYFHKTKEFLSNEDNNIWTWAAKNVEVKAKPKDYVEKIARLVKNALEDDNEGVSADEIIAAVFKGGVSIDDMFNAIEAMTQKEAA